jgi:hypothetical protein
MNARTFAISIVAAVLAVITLASSVRAGCSWVLWTRDGAVIKDWWQASAHETQAQCWDRITSMTFVPREDSWGAKLG